MKLFNQKPENTLQKDLNHSFNIDWNWLYLRSHLVFAFLVFIGMLVFIWWITN